jgi:hypothetical protein
LECRAGNRRFDAAVVVRSIVNLKLKLRRRLYELNRATASEASITIFIRRQQSLIDPMRLENFTGTLIKPPLAFSADSCKNPAALKTHRAKTTGCSQSTHAHTFNVQTKKTVVRERKKVPNFVEHLN